MPANAGVDNSGPGLLNGQRQLFDFLPTGAILNQIEHRKAINQDKFVADRLAYRPDDLHGKTHAVAEAAAPLIITLVGACDQELVDQIAFGTHHFDAVITCLLS
ncbi:hypothetical protein D3C71_1779910 [compost metagenome]